MPRAVAQLGSALDWGSRGRRFKSCQPDWDEQRRVPPPASFSSTEDSDWKTMTKMFPDQSTFEQAIVQ